MRPKRRAKQNEANRLNVKDEIETLEKRIVDEAPQERIDESSPHLREFESLPVSQKTKLGLKNASFTIMTEIQYASIYHALVGRDILGAAATGSGKTLAFLIPLIEKLYRTRWTAEDGLGGLIISPTRELALQTFEVLRKIGKQHNFSAGLLMGGKKDFSVEREVVGRMNILIATPGRLLQHLEQTPEFDASKVQILVLDEADRLLDLGFTEQLNSILTYLPYARQTLLFSATQTRSVKDLARLSLNARTVQYISILERDGDGANEGSDKDSVGLLPERVVQNYLVCELSEKLNVLFSFIKSHLKSKMIVFLSSCAQVQFVYDLFCTLQPGVPLLAIHGKLKQLARTKVYFSFQKKPAGVLFATDIASRGLDFPTVDWVLQVDAPEDIKAYIHRSGRTARYKSKGRVLLFLLPSEEKGMVEMLTNHHMATNKLTINARKMNNINFVTKRAASLVASDVSRKILAEKAFKSYVRSIQIQNVSALVSRNGRTCCIAPVPKNERQSYRSVVYAIYPCFVFPCPIFMASSHMSVDSSAIGCCRIIDVVLFRSQCVTASRFIPQLMPNRDIFREEYLDLSSFAHSLGLLVPPVVPQELFEDDEEGDRRREKARKAKNVNRSLERLKEQIKAERELRKLKRKQLLTSREENSAAGEKVDASSEDDLLTIKKRHVPGDESEVEADQSRSGLKKAKKMKQRINADGVAILGSLARKYVFNDSGEVSTVVDRRENMFAKQCIDETSNSEMERVKQAAELRANEVRMALSKTAKNDWQLEKERLREKKMKKKEQSRKKRIVDQSAEGAILNPVLHGDGENSDSHSSEEEKGHFVSSTNERSDEGSEVSTISTSDEDISSKALSLLRR